MPNEQMRFFIFLLQQYAASRNISADNVLKLWDEHKLTEKIMDMYERYHSEAMENAFEDIDIMLKESVR